MKTLRILLILLVSVVFTNSIFSQGTVKHSVPDTLVEIGDEIYRYDMSFTHEIINGEFREIDNAERLIIKNQLKRCQPMIVKSYPVNHQLTCSYNLIDVNEYFIEVEMKNTGRVFYIINTECTTFKTYYQMMDWLKEVEYPKSIRL